MPRIEKRHSLKVISARVSGHEGSQAEFMNLYNILDLGLHATTIIMDWAVDVIGVMFS